MSARYVLLGLGNARSTWMSNVASWATAGALPIEFSKCVSPAEVAQRLSGLRPYSAVLLDSHDDVVLRAAADARVPVILVSDTLQQMVGTVGTLPSQLAPGELLGALAANCAVISQSVALDILPFDETPIAGGSLIAVCGPGGTGASTVAIALAQQAGADVMQTGLVALADLTMNAEQSMLHDAEDVVPGVEELVEAHRHRRPSMDEVRALMFDVVGRDYELLLGIRRPSAWTAMPPAAVATAIDGLRSAYKTTIVDITADFAGEAQTGSSDIEDRNTLARTTALVADSVVVVGAPTLKGVHSAARVVRDLLELGVDAMRIQVVFNRTPKRFVAKNDVKKALRVLTGVRLETTFAPEAKVESALRDGNPLPKFLKGIDIFPSTSFGAAPLPQDEPQPIKPGSLGIYDEAVGQ